MLGQADIEFQIAQHPRGNDAGDQDRAQHGRDDNVEQIIPGIERGDADHHRDQHVNDSGARDVVIERLPHALDRHATRQIRHRDQSHQRCEHQRGRSQDERCPQVSGIARDGRKQRRPKGQSQPHQRQQEFHPHFGAWPIAAIAPRGPAWKVVIPTDWRSQNPLLRSLAFSGRTDNQDPLAAKAFVTRRVCDLEMPFLTPGILSGVAARKASGHQRRIPLATAALGIVDPA